MTDMKLTDGIVAIVKEASRLMLTDHFEIESKGGYENIVTSSDIAVQEFLVENLGKYIPGSSFLAEEEGMQERGDVEWYTAPRAMNCSAPKRAREPGKTAGAYMYPTGHSAPA